MVIQTIVDEVMPCNACRFAKFAAKGRRKGKKGLHKHVFALLAKKYATGCLS